MEKSSFISTSDGKCIISCQTSFPGFDLMRKETGDGTEFFHKLSVVGSKLSFFIAVLSGPGRCGGVLLCMGSWHFQPVLCVSSRYRHVQPQRRHRVVLRKQSVSAHRFQRQESPQGHVEKHQGQWL